MKRVFKTRTFGRWMRKTELTDEALCLAVDEMIAGLIDADLGGNVVKKRVALPGRGKSGSARTLLATNRGSRWFFMFGFEKNERDNISSADLKIIQKAARDVLTMTTRALELEIENGTFKEICNDC
ncbi:type II toxin-antitoxin system RelE/ParE family toxin [Paraburkholderia sp. BCC1886]|uniref:type II toxin-antitoxin system RelE/ParE family toxin n=1 Tax=Paraburkholderia sp. BCC1886 TaxID=2562670 RepID=UPI001182484F|nr:type II toxin-antitoxin system RelE/ParE family toxin [Paraburkholderia sp. BCC1886]